MRISKLLIICSIIFCIGTVNSFAAKFNAYNLKLKSFDTDHFKFHYLSNLSDVTKRMAVKFESLYDVYSNTYGFHLPQKTEIVVIDGDESNGLTFTNLNFIILWTHDFDFNLRGSHDFIDDVIAHEFAHLMSIWPAIKTPRNIPYFQLGFFSHPNEKRRYEAIHIFPTDILPHWFTEGIAQYESMRQGGDSWDTHRDMILRTLTISDKLLTWPHMQVFAGKGDDFEKTYNHGFSLVKYMAETYGYEKVVSLCKEAARFNRVNFDVSIKEVLGITAEQLYNDWKHSLEKRYKQQIVSIGTQVYGKKLNQYGYDNIRPMFNEDGSKVYFLSNGKNDYSFKKLVSYNFSDTIEDEKKRIKTEAPTITSQYDIHWPSRKILFTSSKSKKSVLPTNQGGIAVRDLFIDTLPFDKKSKAHIIPKKTEKQLTFKKSIFGAAFSPDGKEIACIHRQIDKFYVALVNPNTKTWKVLYPKIGSPEDNINYIYNLSWSPDAKSVAFGYFDGTDRKIGIYNIETGKVNLLCDTQFDERDPRFSPDNRYIYFASDRTGIFNIYRYELSTKMLDKITNVSGGAFMPALSKDCKKIAYSGYAKEGYGIFYLDTLKALESQLIDTAFTERKTIKEELPSINITNSRPYSKMPNKLLVMPMFIGEQAVTQENNINKGKTAFKIGAVFNLFDLSALNGIGNELGVVALMEPKNLFNFINMKQGGINIDANYDLYAFGQTRMFPLTVGFDYLLRGIAGTDHFFDESEWVDTILPYNIQIQDLALNITHEFNNTGGDDIYSSEGAAMTLFGALNRYDATLILDPYTMSFPFGYNIAKGLRFGLLGTVMSSLPKPESIISPEGIAFKLQYDIQQQNSLKEENSFANSSILKERYDIYKYHHVVSQLALGMATPWYSKHTLYFDIRGTAVKSLNDSTIPSFYQPIALVPGYTYYYKVKKAKYDKARGITDSSIVDTVLITGQAVCNGSISYRFPIIPNRIDKKFWIFYLDRFYGAFNFSGGAGFQSPSDFLDLKRKDWLLSAGAELRLEAQTFSSYPFALKLRVDNGFDDKKHGGWRYTFGLGFDFDNWGTILAPESIIRGSLNFR